MRQGQDSEDTSPDDRGQWCRVYVHRAPHCGRVCQWLSGWRSRVSGVAAGSMSACGTPSRSVHVCVHAWCVLTCDICVCAVCVHLCTCVNHQSGQTWGLQARQGDSCKAGPAFQEQMSTSALARFPCVLCPLGRCNHGPPKPQVARSGQRCPEAWPLGRPESLEGVVVISRVPLLRPGTEPQRTLPSVHPSRSCPPGRGHPGGEGGGTLLAPMLLPSEQWGGRRPAPARLSTHLPPLGSKLALHRRKRG